MEPHRHRWTGADFVVLDDRPMMRQSCECGASRDVRAFDVTWTPSAGSADRIDEPSGAD